MLNNINVLRYCQRFKPCGSRVTCVPPIVTVRSKLPMVVVSSVRAELTALGVPAA